MSASIAAVCSGCGAQASVPAAYAGKTVRCKCGTRFQVPALAPPRPQPAATEFEEEPPPRRPAPAATEFEEQPAPRSAAPAATEFEDAASPASAPHPAPHAPTAPGKLQRPPASQPSKTTSSAEYAEWKIGDVVLDLYQVTAILGQGGMGRVYRVRHRGWDVDLAVKVPLPVVLKAVGGADNFEREAETWVNLGLHPHTVSCYYVRRIQGVPRVFAEFVDGGSLDDWIRKRKLTQLEQILDVAIQFAWGLHYAHEQGLVHRDVKPANVMVASDGVAKVTDFGLARARPMGPLADAVGPGKTLMVAGGAGGTPAYMSPEQSAGATLTRRTDLWSWALSVLEMFQGLRTWEFGVAAPEVLHEYLKQGGKAVGRPAMPKGVSRLLEQCFSQDPEARPRTLWDAASVLYGAYEEATATAYPRSEPQAGKDTADSLNNRAVSLLDLGRDTEAEPLWQRALQVQAHHLESTYNLSLHAWSHALIGDTRLLNQMEEARKSHPTLARGHQLLGRLRMAVGDFPHALRELEQACQDGAPTSELQREIGRALLAQAHEGAEASTWQQARDCFAQAQQDGQGELGDIVGQALCLAKLGAAGDAARYYGDARVKRPELPESLEDAVSRYLPGYEGFRSIKGFTHPVTSLGISPDGRWLVAGDGTAARVFEVGSGAAGRSLQEREAKLKAFALTPDGKSLLWGGDNTPPQLWELESGRSLRAFQRHPGILTAIAVSADGRHAVSGGSDRVVRLWEMATGRILKSFEGHQEAVASVAISVDGKQAASGALDGMVRTWDLDTGQALAKLEGHRGRVGAVSFVRTRGFLLSAGEDHTLRLWDPQRNRSRSFEGHQQAVTCLALSPDHSLAYSGSQDQTVRVWDVNHARVVSVLKTGAGVAALAAGPEPGTLWAAHGNTLTALRLPERSNLPPPAVCRPVSAVEVEHRDLTFQGRIDEALESLHQGKLEHALSLTRNARSIPGYERSEAALSLWDEICTVLPRKGLQSAWEIATLPGHKDPVLALGVSADGARGISGGMDATVRLWDLRGRQQMSLLHGHTDTVSAVALGPDGRVVVSGSWDKTVRIWDIASSKALHVLEGHAEYVSAVAVAPEGGQLLSASWDQTLRLWDMARGKLLGEFLGHTSNVSAAAFSPDGRFVASGSWDQTVRVWDVQTRTCVCVLEGHENNVTGVAVGPTGRTVASGGLDLGLRLWDLRTRRTLRVFSGHEAEITAVCFSPDGRYLFSASRDKTVRVWDVSTGKCERILTHTAAVLGLALSPAATEALSAGTDQALHQWHLDWEPDSRPQPPWDEKARPYLETFVSLRLKPETTRMGPASFSEHDVDSLLTDLRKHGFGGLKRETVAGKLQDLTAQADAQSSFWEEVKRAAPKGARAKTRTPLWQRIPKQRIAMGLAVAASFAIAAAGWFRPAAKPRLVHHLLKASEDPRLIRLADFGRDCSQGDATRYLELAVMKDVSADTLGCLARMAGPTTADEYLDAASLTGVEAPDREQAIRNATSLMVALGPVSVPRLCYRLGDQREEVRFVVARALAYMKAEGSARCLTDALSHSSATVRTAATGMIKPLLATGQLGEPEGFALLAKLVKDPAPEVRARALYNLEVYNFEVALPLALAARNDSDGDVHDAAESAILAIEGGRRYEETAGRR